MRVVSFGEGGYRFGVNGVERFLRCSIVIFDDNSNIIYDEFVEEFAKVSDSEQEQIPEIVDYS